MKKRKTSRIKIRIKAKKNKWKILKKHLKDNFEISNFTKFILKKPKRKIRKIKNEKDYIRQFIRFLLSSRIAILLLLLITLLKTIMFHRGIVASPLYTRYVPTFFMVFSSVLVIPLFFIKKDKNRFRFIMFYDIFYSILLFADSVYWEYSASFISYSQIAYLKYAEEIAGTIGYLIRARHFLYFVDIPIILVLWYIARKPINKKKSKFVKNRGKRRSLIAITYTIVILSFITPTINLLYTTMNRMVYNKVFQIELGTILGYHCLDIHNTLNIKDMTKYKTYEEMQEDYQTLVKYKDENFKEEDIYGIAKGKNVIVLQLESVQNFVLNRTIEGKEITPNLNKFINDNIEISKMIVQSYSTTADSEYTAITSLYPLQNGEAFSRYFGNINNDIFKLYKNEGYSTYYMHGNEGGYWNRKSVFSRLPLDQAVFISEFEDTSEKIGGYLSDELFYKQAAQKLDGYNEPFFAYLSAASSHTAFQLVGIEDKYSKVNIDVGKYKNTLFGDYLEAINYADYAFGLFVNELKTKGLYEDSVILVFGDHYGISMGNPEMEEFIKEVNPNYNDITDKVNYVNVLCGIKVPGLEKRNIERPVSKVDIKPTLLGLSGIKDDFSLGKTIFSTKDYAYVSNGHIVTDKFYYDGSWKEIDTGKDIDLNSLNEETKKKLNEYEQNLFTELDISYSIPINNLLK